MGSMMGQECNRWSLNYKQNPCLSIVLFCSIEEFKDAIYCYFNLLGITLLLPTIIAIEEASYMIDNTNLLSDIFNYNQLV